jgi:hypothetical protein
VAGGRGSVPDGERWMCKGEMLELKLTVNSMVEQLSTLADEVTRVTVWKLGILGGTGVRAGMGMFMRFSFDRS